MTVKLLPQIRLSVTVIFLLAFIAGCGGGPEFHVVSGKVIFAKDKSPAQFGSIEFRSETEPHHIARGKIGKDGTFALKTKQRNGAYEGWHTVVIIQASGNTRGPSVKHNHGLDIAKKYLDHRDTELRVNVTEETASELTIEVDDEKPRR
jgi:hypothetical protein